MSKKMFILSIDALETDDIPYLETLPTFSGILEKAAVVKNVREVYPTLTNVNHASIITGVTPDRHGIFHNLAPSVPSKTVNWNIVGQNWFWKSDYFKVPTIIDAAKAKGLITACVTWPGMGGQVPDYNLAEMWPFTKSTLRETYEISCTQNVMDLYFEKFIAPFNFKESFDTDAFTVPIAADIIKRFRPDLLLEHIICLDYCRHKSGNNHPKVRDALKRVDDLLATLLNAFKNAGTYDDTDFFIVGDHGQMDIREAFSLNAALKNHGLVTTDGDGTALDYEAYSFSAGFSAQIILKDAQDEALMERVFQVLTEIQREYPRHIERIYTEDEAWSEEDLAGPFSFIVEATEGVCFENAFDGPVTISSDDPAYHAYRSNHGYHPSKGPKPPLIAFGPNIKEAVTIDGASILDECPTFAKVLGVELPGMLGNALDIIK